MANELLNGIEIMIKESSADPEEKHEEHTIEKCGLKKLIKEEDVAIESYDEAIEHYKDNPKIVNRLTEIRDDEKEHKKELEELLESEEPEQKEVPETESEENEDGE